MPHISNAVEELIANIIGLFKRQYTQDDFVLVPGEPEEVVEVPKGARVTVGPIIKRDALGEYVVKTEWRHEETPCFDGMVADWLMAGKEVPAAAMKLARVPQGAMDALSRAAKRSLKQWEQWKAQQAGQFEATEESLSGALKRVRESLPNPEQVQAGTAKPRKSRKGSRKSGNPAKRAEAAGPVTRLGGTGSTAASEAAMEAQLAAERRRNGLD